MKMPKHSDEDKARFRALVPDGPGVEVKPMFGSVGAFVNGNMFAGLFGTDIGVKLDDEAKAELE
jgi:TfoX/Sxy family transcriptional regulator of competence genes